MRNTFLLSGLIAGALLTGCANLPAGLTGQYRNSADVYTPGQAQQTQGVQLGTVVAVRSVTIAATQTETAGGSAIGAALGGLLGHQVGDGKGRTLATVAGAVAGGLGGNLVGQHAYQQPGLEISVKLDGGNIVSVTQATDVNIAVGERVQLIAGNGWASVPSRVVPLGGVR